MVRAYAVSVWPLESVVQFAQQRLAQLPGHPLHADAASRRRMVIEEAGHLFDRLHVLEDLLAHVGALYLGGHLAPAAQRGAVHLAERGGGQRRAVETRKRFPQADAD